jgi:glycosyltransferase involved in cell wall biosynthesis
MPGFVTDVAAHFGVAKCLVVSSRVESFGLTCVEGLAHGLPVIATDCGGPAEALGAAAFAPPPPVGDVAALAAQIAAALRDPGAPAPRQARARLFSLEAALDAYDALFRTLPRGTEKDAARRA